MGPETTNKMSRFGPCMKQIGSSSWTRGSFAKRLQTNNLNGRPVLNLSKAESKLFSALLSCGQVFCAAHSTFQSLDEAPQLITSLLPRTNVDTSFNSPSTFLIILPDLSFPYYYYCCCNTLTHWNRPVRQVCVQQPPRSASFHQHDKIQVQQVVQEYCANHSSTTCTMDLH